MQLMYNHEEEFQRKEKLCFLNKQ